MVDDDLDDDDLGDDPFAEETRTPVHVVGRVIARSPVGALWCGFIDQCGSPGRAERGQAYVRAGAVVDLKVRPGCITAEVDGAVRVRPIVNVPLGRERYLSGLWTLPEDQGRYTLQFMLPKLDVLPVATELLGSCGCADRVPLCEHVLAALYGFGARLDAEPELLLLLRGAETTLPPAPVGLVIAPLAPDRVALTGSLAALFNLNLRDDPLPADTSLLLEDSPDATRPDAAASELASQDAQDVSADASPGSPAAPTGTANDEIEPTDGTRPAAASPGPATQLAEVRREYLKFIGIRSRTIDIWIREGVLLPTDRFHVYRRTEEANRRIAAKLAR